MLNNDFSTKLMIYKKAPQHYEEMLDNEAIKHTTHSSRRPQRRYSSSSAMMKGETPAKELENASHNQHYVKYIALFINIMMHSA